MDYKVLNALLACPRIDDGEGRLFLRANDEDAIYAVLYARLTIEGEDSYKVISDKIDKLIRENTAYLYKIRSRIKQAFDTYEYPDLRLVKSDKAPSSITFNRNKMEPDETNEAAEVAQPRVEKTFAYHKPSDDGLAKIKKIRQAATAFFDAIKENAPDTRERSLALSWLETTAMWAIKAVVCNDPASVVDDR